MSTKVYSFGYRLAGIALLVATVSCGGNGVTGGVANSSSDFDRAMTKQLQGQALAVYEQDKAKSLTYAQEVCGYLDAGNSNRNFTGTEFGSYLSYELNSAQQDYAAAIMSAAVNQVCPQHRSKL